jgi:hypothetical protein
VASVDRNIRLASATAGDSSDDDVHWSMGLGIVEAMGSLQEGCQESRAAQCASPLDLTSDNTVHQSLWPALRCDRSPCGMEAHPLPAEFGLASDRGAEVLVWNELRSKAYHNDRMAWRNPRGAVGRRSTFPLQVTREARDPAARNRGSAVRLGRSSAVTQFRSGAT